MLQETLTREQSGKPDGPMGDVKALKQHMQVGNMYVGGGIVILVGCLGEMIIEVDKKGRA